MAPLAPLVTLIGSFIGLAQEARRYRQIHKNAAATENVSSRTAENSTKRADGKLNLPSISEEICPKSSLSDSITQEVPALLNDHRDIDEEEPLLKPTAQEDPVCLIFHEETDEKHASLNPPTQKENVGLVDTNRNKTGEKESDGLVRLSDYQRSTTSGTKRGTHLSDPVILPQRRPRWKNHGFIRAYAPALRECDIDEEQFLDFTDNFHQTAKPSPWFRAIEPIIIPIGIICTIYQVWYPVAMTAHGVIEAGREIHARLRTNASLNQINQELFMQHGLFCLILKFKPDQENPGEPIDIAQAILKTAMPAKSPISRLCKNIRSSDGVTYGELELPKAASLVFPILDKKPDARKRKMFTRGKNFVDDYYDKRSRARYAHRYPKSSLIVSPTPRFISRYSDPNHPANNGSILSLLTGGRVDSREMRVRRRQRQQQREELRGKASRHDEWRRKRRRAYKGFTRILTPNVRYLIIVNLPSEKQLEAIVKLEGSS